MNKHLFLALSASSALLAGCVQQSAVRITDPYRLTEPKNFTAHRASSNNPDGNSNDDSKRPIPGETTVLADLHGPGVVNHIWMTIADNEYGWPRRRCGSRGFPPAASPTSAGP